MSILQKTRLFLDLLEILTDTDMAFTENDKLEEIRTFLNIIENNESLSCYIDNAKQELLERLPLESESDKDDFIKLTEIVLQFEQINK